MFDYHTSTICGLMDGGTIPEQLVSTLVETRRYRCMRLSMSQSERQPRQREAGAMLTAAELARVLGCRKGTIMQLMRNGAIPGLNIGTAGKQNFRFCLQSVQAALAVKQPPKPQRKTKPPVKPFLV